MAVKASKRKDYQEMSLRLDEIMAAIAAPDVTIDQATALYKEAMELINDMEEYLKTAENKITALKSEFLQHD